MSGRTNGIWSKRGFGQAWYLVKKRGFLKGPFLLFSVVMFSDSTGARLLRNRVECEGNCAVRSLRGKVISPLGRVHDSLIISCAGALAAGKIKQAVRPPRKFKHVPDSLPPPRPPHSPHPATHPPRPSGSHTHLAKAALATCMCRQVEGGGWTLGELVSWLFWFGVLCNVLVCFCSCSVW